MQNSNSLEPQATFNKFFGRPTLDRFDGENGVEILINTKTGESFCSISGYARMANKAQSTISDRLPIGEVVTSMGQTLTAGGLQGVRLITEDQIVEWLPKDNPIAASQLLKMGVRMALHQMAGYSVSSTAVNPEPDRYAELRERVELAKSLAGNPGAIDAYKALFQTPPAQPPEKAKGTPGRKPKPEPAPVAEEGMSPSEILNDFLAKLNAMASRDIINECSYTRIVSKFKTYLAVHLAAVWPLMVEHFTMQYDRRDLECAIVLCQGSRRSLQRFLPKKGGEKKTAKKHAILIPVKPISATSSARTLLESTINADTAISSSVAQNTPKAL